ncbi:uncharacterized protein TRAVEDRAFT_132465 [Trametes versicolor FP-101664 SS1]|uniref:uncharacterized protein n=1 Tax=Trametes versicolor (strain FP-101664) TaxID=717944 RepID=UPI000462333A|nr:uncharacterized protein TRAVEDRAFT_132465 [Trametes versicolor FP-101664 SS1]EIW54269.1 hypothetical protein TRAVEDRAFT_132465 [Trametes versicolor FP-101664 SS1]
MKRATCNSPFPPSCLAAAEEVARFDGTGNHCCDKDHFKIDISQGALNKWNKSASMVFARAFVDSGRFDCENVEEVAAAFTTHVRTLRKNYREQQLSADARHQLQSKANREQRKITVCVAPPLFFRRRHVAMKYPQLAPHLPMLEQLGVDGMSSDESDSQNGVKYYRILRKSWRPERVTLWVRGFDAVEAISRPSNARGNQPRKRMQSTKVDDSRDAVKGLPRNAYDATWYAKLGDFAREDLCRSEETYSFDHCPAVWRYVLLLLATRI